MPVQLSLVERMMVRIGVIPAPMVDFAQHTAFRLLLAGHRLGVFDALNDGPRDLTDLSATLAANAMSLEPFLLALVRLGYLARTGNSYRNTAAATRWLTADSPATLKGIVPFLEDHIHRWEHLEQTIKTGHPPFTAYDFYRAHPERWASFHDGQRAVATFTVDEAARKADLREVPLRLIDVGGSHGLYTVALCRRYKLLSAVIYDWADGVEAARREIANAGMRGRIDTQCGDFLLDDLGHGYDVALLGNIIHGQRPLAIVDLLRRLRAALNSGGTLLIVDQVRMRQPFTRLAGYMAEVAGLLLLNELGGGLYPYGQLRKWLLETGYVRPRLRRLWRTPGFVLIRASVD